jgi:hypothetical protein
MMLRSTQYGSVVKHLEPEHVQELVVPDAAETLYAAMRQTLDHVFNLREKAFLLTQEAEAIYTTQFPVQKPQDPEGYEVSASAIFAGRRRLDAFHYNPLARSLEQSLRSVAPVENLASVAERIVLPNRFKRVYVEDGIPFIDSEDVFKINPEVTKFIAPTSKSDLEKYEVERGWLLIARSGQTYGLNGSVMLANAGHEGKIVSEHIIRIVPGKIRPGYLAMALGHPSLGRPLVMRLTFGSSVPEISPEDLASLPVPRLGTVEDEIADRVAEASLKRLEADRIEDAAVQQLEEDIKIRLRGGISEGDARSGA